MYLLNNIWSLLLEMSPYLLLGFLFSGLLSVLLTVDTVTKYLGGNKFKQIFLASLFGIPLPLCSCGVIPVFSYLRKHGASKATTTSFLISTPQTGVDSILVTYSLLGPIFAIYRPIVAFISGLLGGTFVAILDNKNTVLENSDKHCDDECCDEDQSKLYRIFDYGFIKLPQDISIPLIIGIITAALIYYFIPENYFEYIGSGILGMLIMLILGLPTYVCATASIPIALALHLKGFSMGSLMVFLMSGPATNIATISVAIKQLGKKSTGIYLGSIIFCSILAGVVFDLFFPGLNVERALGSTMKMISYPVKVFSASVLIVILLNSIRLSYFSNSNNDIIIKGAKTLYINGMTCNNCVISITKTLNKLKGVNVININLKSGEAIISASSNNLELVKQSIKDLGFEIK